MTPAQQPAEGLSRALQLLGRWDRRFRIVPKRRRLWSRPATQAQLDELSTLLHGNAPQDGQR
jgi:hypothetical protein